MERTGKNLPIRSTRSTRRRRPRSLQIERCEERQVMDAAFAFADVFRQDVVAEIAANSSPVQRLDDGTLAIYGGDLHDDARVSVGGGKIWVTLNDQTYSFDEKTSFTYHRPARGGLLMGPPIQIEIPNVTKIEFYGGGGDDRFQNDTSLPTTAYGGPGDDFLIGGSVNDRLEGGDGDDALLGQDGSDTLIGGRGVDRMQGNGGNDILRGGGDNDELFGGAGNDRLYGNDGNDVLYGEEGVDKLYGGNGHDDLWGGNGFDDLVGGAGVDWFQPGTDNVWIDDPETGYVPYDGGVRMVTVDDHRSVTNLVPHNEQLAGTLGFLDLNNLWSLKVDETRAKILERLEGARPAGQSLYDIRLDLPSQGIPEIAQDEWGTHLRLTLPGAYLEATSTQPTVLGSWADPRFGVSFDITVDVHLAPTGGLRVTSSTATLSNASIRPVNVVADVVNVFNAIAGYFHGFDFKALGEQAVNQTQFKNAIDTSMTAFVNALAPNASVTYDAASGVVLLRTARHGQPVDISKGFWEASPYVPERLDTALVTADSMSGAVSAFEDFRRLYEDHWVDVLTDDRFSESNDSPLPGSEFDLFEVLGVASEMDWSLLNPQPLPPRETTIDVALPPDIDWSLLNPQPLPPRESSVDVALSSDIDWSLLNPQPLPPRETSLDVAVVSDLDHVLLNPQPLPPRDFSAAATRFLAFP